MCKEYNGYTNYETWAVALWIDNEEGSYNYWRERTQEAESIHELEDMLKDEHEENMPEVTGIYSDLLQAALDSVNWYEIAENYWKEYREEEEEELENE